MVHHPVDMPRKPSGPREYGDLLRDSLTMSSEAQKPQVLSTTRYASIPDLGYRARVFCRHPEWMISLRSDPADEIGSLMRK